MANEDRITPSLQKIESELKRLPQQAYEFWVSKTPERSGNAKSKTKLRDGNIVADYAYAKRLDQGWSSQAPEGMSKPTEQFIKQTLDKKMRK
jgi:hypothetical protein